MSNWYKIDLERMLSNEGVSFQVSCGREDKRTPGWVGSGAGSGGGKAADGTLRSLFLLPRSAYPTTHESILSATVSRSICQAAS